MSARWLIVALILIKALVPGSADKAEVADKLREAARLAGCGRPVVEIESPDQQSFEITVFCRDDGDEKEIGG